MVLESSAGEVAIVISVAAEAATVVSLANSVDVASVVVALLFTGNIIGGVGAAGDIPTTGLNVGD